MWPLSGFEETGTWLTQKHNLRTVIVGGPSEKALCSALSRKIGESSINAAGRLTLRQSATLLECCSIFLGNDSGLMHVAATVGLPVIALYSHPENVPTSANNLPERFRPWTASYTMLRPPRAIPPCTVDCIANNSHCICDISTVMVKEAIAQQLTRTQIRKQGHKHT
jgi:heptosyltransferase-2